MYATIWIAGIVYMTMGYAEMSGADCNSLRDVIISDIELNIDDNQMLRNPRSHNEVSFAGYEVTCENEIFPIGYVEEE